MDAKKIFKQVRASLSVVAFSAFALACASTLALAQPAVLQVCVTTPDLGSLVREVGGDRVAVTEFTKGPQDPHYVDAKPSFIKLLNRADLFCVNGLELEIGWAPVLIRTARNSKVVPGSSGYADCSTAISPLEVLATPADRSMGHIHPHGNPHYLLDPINGLKVAGLLEGKLSAMQPTSKDYFHDRYVRFKAQLVARLLGEKLAAKYRGEQIDKLLALLDRGGSERTLAFLKKQNQTSLLGGWLGTMHPYFGSEVIADHNLWPYFARRFGVRVVGFLEPKPGISPTTKHLTQIIRLMQEKKIRAILSSPYFNPRHARVVAQSTAAKIAAMAHQVGARKGASTYLDTVGYNVSQLTAALGSAP